MNQKRLPSIEDQRRDSFLKRLRTVEDRAVKYSKVVLRFGPKLEEYEFSLPLLPLVAHSVKIRKCIESSFDEDGKGSAAVCKGGRHSPVIIDMPGFQCDADTLKRVEDMVGDICCGMDERDISTLTVVRLFNAAEFLEIEIVKCKLLAFLEENAFISWEKCLDVLATFDCNDLQHDRREGNTLFERCRKAFLHDIEKKDLDNQHSWTKRCNVECLLRVALLLPPNAAKYIFESCRAERLGLYYKGNVVSISLHMERKHDVNFGCAEVRPSTTCFTNATTVGPEVRWMEDLPNLLPDLSRRSLLLLHLAKMMRLGSEVTASISKSYLNWGFLCTLLVEATKESAKAQQNGLDIEIGFLEKLVIEGLIQAPKPTFYNFEVVVKLVTKFKFGTLLSIVKHLGNIVSGEDITFIAKVVDNCILENLKTSSYTAQQALMIYKEFPNSARVTHVELYHTMRTAALSAEEAVEFSKLLDYNKVPDDITEEFSGDLAVYFDPRLGKRVLDILELRRVQKELDDKELTKLRSEQSLLTAEVTKLRSEFSVQTTELMKIKAKKKFDETKLKDEVKRVVKVQKAINQELVQLRRERDAAREADKALQMGRDKLSRGKRLTAIERKILAEGKKLAESQQDTAQYDLEEKEKTTCQICFKNSRDALSLPCMHFLYCINCLDNHHQGSKTCPACRVLTIGVLRCNLTI